MMITQINSIKDFKLRHSIQILGNTSMHEALYCLATESSNSKEIYNYLNDVANAVVPYISDLLAIDKMNEELKHFNPQDSLDMRALKLMPCSNKHTNANCKNNINNPDKRYPKNKIFSHRKHYIKKDPAYIVILS